MRPDSRLSRMLHVLLHMARHDAPFTSEQIAKMLGTNAVVVRRTMSGLREVGYVRSVNGRGGGWSIAVDLDAVTLLDIHRAVASSTLFSLSSGNLHPVCAVERAVNQTLDSAMREAEALLMHRLGQVSLAMLAERFDQICRNE
ncbi:Rrf2 family transcriptional regulator [Manganibacter manganicus]|uniref:BadM/Rrf2 family transcriptional regulator n=1 Tax=Manganibacter manganicus TaxID=1873176 RepID=A0A1V8RL42_9HYPH|nr:Rrf2 family transcriptional regulator [Pseudaminobacter manganicus]OQM73864.1 BadM/Rrf2 family transcriptional regulator [Pseudaminobacter manganicus]